MHAKHAVPRSTRVHHTTILRVMIYPPVTLISMGVMHYLLTASRVFG